MTTTTLRDWGGAVAVSLPKKVLAALGLQSGSQVQVRIEDGNIVLSPARKRFSLEQLEREHRALERRFGKRLADAEWLDAPPAGRESL